MLSALMLAGFSLGAISPATFAQGHEASLAYTPPPMFDSAPADGQTAHDDSDYAQPTAGNPTQVIENTKLYNLPVESTTRPLDQMLDKSTPVPVLSFKTPPLPTNRPNRFAVSKAYARSLLESAYGRSAPQNPAALKVRQMNAADVLKTLE